MSEASMIHRHDMIIVFIVASRRTSTPVSSVHRNTVPMTVPEGSLIRLADTRFFSFRKPSRSLVSEYFPSDMTFPIILDGTTYFPSSLTSTCVSRKMFPPPLTACVGDEYKYVGYAFGNKIDGGADLISRFQKIFRKTDLVYAVYGRILRCEKSFERCRRAVEKAHLIFGPVGAYKGSDYQRKQTEAYKIYQHKRRHILYEYASEHSVF